MQIKKLELKNFAIFENLVVDFAPQNQAQGKVTVFIGNNGTGKTAILKALALSLTWLVARIERERGSGSPINELDISNGTNFAQISLMVEEQGKAFQWTLAKTAKGKKSKAESSLTEATKLADIYRTQFTENNKTSFPLIIYYPVERVVLDVPLKIRTKHSFEQLDGYDNSLQGVDFRRFFEWFRDREDIENEDKDNFFKRLEQLAEDKTPISSLSDEKMRLFLNMMEEHVEDIQLKAVRDALHSFMPNFSDLRIQRKPRLQMLVNKKGIDKPLDVLQLSQGEKSLMALVGDIARRLAIMNPALENPLLGEGVVMIDEIDMHLHPRWQQTILTDLTKVFQNIQFIITTHSPQVLSTIPHHQIRILNNGTICTVEDAGTQGAEASRILQQIFDVNLRAQHLEIVQKLNSYLASVDGDKWDSPEALKLRKELDEWCHGNEPELIKADIDIRMKEYQRQL